MSALPPIVDEIERLYAARAQGNYFGEAITQLEHGLQSAYFAEQAGAPETVIIAALLHDVGHLVVDVPEDLADWTHDAQHEHTGADWLVPYFGPAVTEPVRLHVAAKRYLCATDSDYFARLSPASVSQRQGRAFAIVVGQHAVATVQGAFVDGIQQLEGRHHSAGGQHFDFQAATGHVIDFFGEVVGVFVEDVFGGPSALKAQ